MDRMRRFTTIPERTAASRERTAAASACVKAGRSGRGTTTRIGEQAAGCRADLGDAIPLISPLINLPIPESYPRWFGTPEEQHRRLLGILVKWLCASAQIQPLVLVVEDLQWVDPSTLLLQELLAEQGATVPMILLFTSRPEFRPPWPSRAHHAQLALNRLSPGQVIELIAGKAAESAIARDVVDAVVKRAGGVPLFAEELTQLVMDSDRKTIAQAIPATLHDSLMARLDHLGSARDLVKVGAAIGSEFSYELLQAVTRKAHPELQAALKRATDAELLYVRGIAPESSYMFKHALVRDVAYGTLLKSRRRELHHAIARALTPRSSERTSSQPELIAHHLTEAGEFDSATTEWSRAGARAVARGALKEAENHFSRALELLDKLGDEPELARRKLNVNLSLAGHAIVAWFRHACNRSDLRSSALSSDPVRKTGGTHLHVSWHLVCPLKPSRIVRCARYG